MDIAIKKAKQKASLHRNKTKIADKIKKIKETELVRINYLRNYLVDRFQHIISSFPKIDELPKFYNELIKCTLDYDELKNSLGAINWAIKRINEFYRVYNKKIKYFEKYDEIIKNKKEFYGRVSSVVAQIDDFLIFLEKSRRTLKKFPAIKTSLKTIAIVGFPNVGKTTLLFKLTGSKPEIKNYAFTTKNINVAYLIKDNEKIQLLDTPGSLNRFNKMNQLEKQSYLAVKYLAENIIYVFDLTESYQLKEQEKLFENLKKIDKEIIIFFGKADIVDKKILDIFKKKYENNRSFTNINELKDSLF